MARTLTHRWKVSAAGAFVVIVLIGIAAGNGGEAADDFSAPGTETQAAIDLFKAHSPAFAGADSTVVFKVAEGRIDDPGQRPRSRVRWRRSPGSREWTTGQRSVRRGWRDLAGQGLASVDVRYSTDPSEIKKADGEALVAAGESTEKSGVQAAARGLIDIGAEQDAPVRRAGRRLHRDLPARVPVPLLGGDGATLVAR